MQAPRRILESLAKMDNKGLVVGFYGDRHGVDIRMEFLHSEYDGYNVSFSIWHSSAAWPSTPVIRRLRVARPVSDSSLQTTLA